MTGVACNRFAKNDMTGVARNKFATSDMPGVKSNMFATNDMTGVACNRFATNDMTGVASNMFVPNDMMGLAWNDERVQCSCPRVFFTQTLGHTFWWVIGKKYTNGFRVHTTNTAATCYSIVFSFQRMESENCMLTWNLHTIQFRVRYDFSGITRLYFYIRMNAFFQIYIYI